MLQNGENGVVRGHPMSSVMLPFDGAHATSYSSLIETMCLYCTVFKILTLFAKILRQSCDPDHAPFRDGQLSKGDT